MSGFVNKNNELPEGWNIVTLNDICEIKRTGTFIYI
jgi:hypothetical protein